MRFNGLVYKELKKHLKASFWYKLVLFQCNMIALLFSALLPITLKNT